ncbi:hypothetical protein DAI22_06g106500 [Oryza sativa Japonica Group]|nr:hypothetical protein DAI22_06g106500 [Oryza sativa Japonica Group]
MPHPLPQAPPRPIRRSITVPPPRRSPTCGRLLCLKRHHIRFVVAPPSLRLALTLSLLRRKVVRCWNCHGGRAPSGLPRIHWRDWPQVTTVEI